MRRAQHKTISIFLLLSEILIFVFIILDPKPEMASSEALPQIPAVELNNLLSRLESRPKPLLSHEFGVGSPCNRCDCPGLDLHFWRKMCKVCSCRLDEHDILPLDGQQDHGAVVTRRLFGANKQQPPLGGHGIDKANSEAAAGDEWLIGRLKLEEGKENSHRRRQQQQQGIGKEESSRQEDKDSNSNYGIRLMDRPPVKLPPRAAVVVPPPPPPNVRQLDFAAPSSVIYENTAALWREGEVGHRPEDWAWKPAGDWRLAQRYLLSLAEGERPLKGSDGAQLRRQRLAQQLPDHDSDVAASKAGRGPREMEMHREFVELVKREVVGIAEVVDYGQHKAQFAHKLPAGNGKGTEEFQCRKCADKFCQPDVGLVTDHERESAEAIWHPRCFNCSVCGQLLVDLLYFFHGGKYFCGRHFGEKLYPRCAGCDELIFAREYTFAEEKSWHLEHFCCFGCDQHLSGQRYVVKEDQPFCVDCYLAKFARTCATCCNKIAPFDQRVTYGEIHWHASPQCFKCKSCAKPLSNQKFLLKGEEPFCSSECKVRSGF